MTAAPGWAAHLDPWCLVPLLGGETMLFGFALVHPSTGGLSWLSSTELLVLDDVACRAETRSGRRYRLGRRFQPIDVSAEGEEARAAFELLIGEEFDGTDELQELDRMWLTACKAARHLGLTPPVRREADVSSFLSRNLLAYLAARQQRMGS